MNTFISSQSKGSLKSEKQRALGPCLYETLQEADRVRQKWNDSMLTRTFDTTVENFE